MRYDKDGLTYRERDIYNYIIRFKQINGFSPSQKEIADGVLTSLSFVRVVLDKLSDKGFIKYSPNKYRSIVVLKFLNNTKIS